MNSILNFLLGSKTASALFIQILLSVFLSVGSLIIFFKISREVLESAIIIFDVIITNYIVSFRSPQTTELMLFFTFLGGIFVFVTVSILMIFYIYSKRKKDAFIYLSIIYSAVIINFLLKLVFQRPRPEIGLIPEITYSFPSGHAMNSFVLYMTFTYFIFRETKNKKLTFLIGVLSLFLIFMIGISRIYLGVHYPSDVLTGWIGGFFLLISAILCEKVIILERLYKKFKK